MLIELAPTVGPDNLYRARKRPREVRTKPRPNHSGEQPDTLSDEEVAGQ